MSFVLEMMSVRDLWNGKSVADKWFNVSEAQGSTWAGNDRFESCHPMARMTRGNCFTSLG